MPEDKQVFAYGEQFSPKMDCPKFSGDPNIYLIASTPRCGSHYLGHALTETGYFGVPLEYLNSGNFAGWHARFGKKPTENMLKDLIAHRTSPSGNFGFKAHWSQFRPFQDRLGALAPIKRIVFIRRRNLLSQAISYLKAEQTGQWISGAPKTGEAEYSYRQIIRRARNIKEQNNAWATYFATTGIPVFSIFYEDLLANPELNLASIFGFICPNCPAKPKVSTRTQRQSDEVSEAWKKRLQQDLRPRHSWIMDPQGKSDVKVS